MATKPLRKMCGEEVFNELVLKSAAKKAIRIMNSDQPMTTEKMLEIMRRSFLYGFEIKGMVAGK